MKLFMFVVLGIFSTSTAWAARDCTQVPNEVTADNIVTILETYYGDCLGEAVKNRLSNTVLETDETKRDILKSWEAIVADIGKDLADKVPSKDMEMLYQEVQKRSISAKEDAARPKEGADRINMAERNYWQLTNALILFPVPQYLYVLFPLKPVFERACEAEGVFCPLVLKQAEQLLVYLGSAEQVAAQYSVLLVKGMDKLMKELFAPKWNTFFYDSKPMYPLDIFATDLAYRLFSDESRTSYRDGFREPPAWQVFFLHPAGAFEYVDKAEDGQELKPTVYAEIIGVNYWEDGFLGLTGLSIIASYSDRKDVRDVGWGGLLTYSNVYSLGVTTYDGDLGFFVSLDLANLYRDKLKKTWREYKKIKNKANLPF